MYYVGKKFLSLLLVFTLVFSMTGLFDNQAFAASRIITVKQDGTGDYTTINDAAQAAQPGDTIVVYGGTYRETVTFPRGGNGESSRITLKAASGQKPVITGSNVVTGWAKDSGSTYRLVKDSAYFGDFNPFATKWQAKGSSYSDYFSCGCVYGLYSSSGSTEVSKEQYNSINTEVVLSKAPNVNPDYSGGSWSQP